MPKTVVVPLTMLLVLAAAPASADDAYDPNTRDLLVIAEWFEGEFDNEEQVWFHRRSRADGEEPTRLHVSNRRVELDQFGEHVFYVEEYRDHNPEEVYRQRLVVFSSEGANGSIRMQQGFFKNPQAVLGAQTDTTLLDNLAEDDVLFLDECDVFFRRIADQYHGSMRPKACVFGEGDERRYSVHDIVLSASKFWRVDATYRVSDDSFFRGTPPGTESQLRRAKIFYCSFYFYGDDGNTETISDLRVHGQGGTVTAVRSADNATFEILIRDKEYPYYATRPDFLYYSIRRFGEHRSIAFGVTDPDSRQFGTRAGEVGAFCHREGYAFREPVEML